MMKKVFFLVVCLCTVSNIFAQNAMILPFGADSLTNEQKLFDAIYVAYPLSIENEIPDMKCDNIEAVDLGLSVKWATCNIGAESPEDAGYYFAWGETQRSVSYNWISYKWCRGTETTLTKYCTDNSYGSVDNKTVLDRMDDAATMNWGNEWRMPTNDEYKELKDSCDWVWTTQNGRNGYTITSRINGNSIFLPAAGYIWTTNNEVKHIDVYASYWSSSLYEINPIYAYYLYFGNNIIQIDGYQSRNQGHTIRPVCP